MSPVVLRLPVICRSDDSTEAGGLGLGALALKSLGVAAEVSGTAGFGASGAFGPGSLILLLENIVCSLDIDHWIDGLSAHAHLVVQMGAGYTPGCSHITDTLAARYPLSDVHANFGQMGIAGLDPELVLDLDQTPVTRLPARMDHHPVGGGIERRAHG